MSIHPEELNHLRNEHIRLIARDEWSTIDNEPHVGFRIAFVLLIVLNMISIFAKADWSTRVEDRLDQLEKPYDICLDR